MPFLARQPWLRYDEFVMDEASAIGRAQRGDLDAFNSLVVEYQTLVYNVAFRIMGESASAADASQEAFISAFKNIRRYRGGSFRAWLLRIVTNACYDELRRRKRKPTLSLDELAYPSGEVRPAGLDWVSSNEESPEASLQRSDLARAIQECLDRLPPEFRVVAVLVDVQGYDYKEAAEVVGTPLGTVKSRLARARAGLRECLQGYRELLPVAFRLEDEGSE